MVVEMIVIDFGLGLKMKVGMNRGETMCKGGGAIAPQNFEIF